MKGHTAIITGAGRGIGKEVSEALRKAWVNIVVVDINLDMAREAASDLEKLGGGIRSIGVKADVSSSSDVGSLFETALKEFGKVEILVNNAGITKDGLLMRMKEEDWDAVININLKGTFLCSKEAVKVMARERYGRIINIASVVAFMGNAGQANYSASKAGHCRSYENDSQGICGQGVDRQRSCPGFHNYGYDRCAA